MKRQDDMSQRPHADPQQERPLRERVGVYIQARDTIDAIRIKFVSGCSSEPIIQNIMPCKFSVFETAIKSIRSEEQTKLIITPHKRSSCILSILLFMLREYNRIITTTAPKKPDTGMDITPKRPAIPKIIFKVTPKAAPPEIPKVYGSTKGFLKIP